MNFPPTVYLVGAQKAGTTFLASLLDQDPQIRVSQPKEPHFFTQNWERGLEWYRSCFPEPDSAEILVDASPSYSAAPVHREEVLVRGEEPGRMAAVPRRIAEVAPGARFIYLLRDPVERVFSAYWHDVRIGEEARPFREALRQEPKYLNMSDYLGQIRHYLRFFPVERFLFLRFEDLRADPQVRVRQVTEFLGTETTAEVVTDTGRHSGYRPGAVMGGLLAARKRVPGMDSLQEAVWSMLPVAARERLRRHLVRSLPELDPDDREMLAEHFRPMVEPLQEMTGLDLSVWGIARTNHPSGRGKVTARSEEEQ
ncbi:sulfotransferase family protein [Thiohalorhabdus sp.]|uniref:sulfotransferase family protein n=1 Tax=Thiohalorhabdus sp. TaxID=3094134 RepID=UPI002FC295F1